MGGGDSAGMPSSGGMTVYNQLGYDPSKPQGGGINWMSLLAQAAEGYKSAGGIGNISAPSMNTPNSGIPSGSDYPTITIPTGGGGSQGDIVQALLRLLGGR